MFWLNGTLPSQQKGLKRDDRTTLVVMRREEQRLASEVRSLKESETARAAAQELDTQRRDDLETRIDGLLV